MEPSGDGADDRAVAASEIISCLQLPDDPTGAIGRLRHIISLQRWGWSGGELFREWYVQVSREIYRFADVNTLDKYLEVMAVWEEEGRHTYVAIPDENYGDVPPSLTRRSAISLVARNT